MLESTLFERWHIDPGDRFHTASNDFAFELIKALMIPVGQFNKGD
jgi:hypothetical protein